MTLRLKILIAVGVGALLGFLGWAFHAMRSAAAWTGGSGAIAALIVGGVVGTGALTGLLMWLAFYSARKGYDEAPTLEPADPDTPTDQRERAPFLSPLDRDA